MAKWTKDAILRRGYRLKKDIIFLLKISLWMQSDKSAELLSSESG